MVTDTEGIVLKHTLFGDNDIIVKILTEKLGLVSFIVKGGKKSNKKKYLQPLMLVSISFKNKNKGLHYLNKIQLNEVSSVILNNYEKRILALFLCEIISKCLQEGVVEKGTYNFIYKQIQWLNQKSNSAKYFELWFLANFTKLLGIQPNQFDIKKQDITYFNIQTASFSSLKKEGSWNKEASLFLYNLLNNDLEKLKNFSLNNNLSKFVLTELVNYYSYHLNDLKLYKCLDVYHSLKI